MGVFRQMLLLGALALIPAIATALWHPPVGERLRPFEVSLATVRGWSAPVLWIDARADADYQRAHVPGALPLNAAGWERQLPAIIGAWRPEAKTVVYCTGHSCEASTDIAQRLREDVGLVEVYFLAGGWDAWQRAQRP